MRTDGAFGRQPAPTPEAPPKQFSAELAESMLERPLAQAARSGGAPTSWQDQNRDDVEPLIDEYETGQVSELDESVGETAA